MGTYRVRIILFLMLLIAPVASAETLVQYDFTGLVLTATTQASGIAGGTLTNGSLGRFTAISGSSYPAPPVLRTGTPSSGTNTAAAAVTNNSYFSFSVTPTNYEMDLTSLTFSIAQGSSCSGGYAVRSSIDSYANNIATASIGNIFPTMGNISISLTGASYQNLTSAITFRLYVYNASTGCNNEWDTITLNGTLTSTVGGGGGVTTTDTFDDAPPTLTRYIQMQRTGTTVTAKIYSDINYSVLLDTLTVTDTATAYRYLYAPLANNTAVTGSTFSGSVSDMDVTIQTGVTCDTSCAVCATQATCSASAATCYWWSNNSCNAITEPPDNPAATIGIYMTGGTITGCSIQ